VETCSLLFVVVNIGQGINNECRVSRSLPANNYRSNIQCCVKCDMCTVFSGGVTLVHKHLFKTVIKSFILPRNAELLKMSTWV